MTTTLPELLLPAGGFESGIAALEGGADALYLGFSEFSARRQARNFGREEYRRLLRLARSSGKKIHVAVNTVILESELEGAAGLLAFLGEFPPDALIVQDWGLVALVRERFPGLAVHASTQTAAQGPGAARLALERGATRLVLPRECGLAELRLLHEALPELEYEVFVHGALCYSFSGLCLASGRLLGRSGNRGECAQVCRSYYRAESGPGIAGKTGYWFSCKDLNLEADLSALVEAGAASLKVEGRMKSPEYAYAVARLYRGALDRLAGLPGAPSEAEMEARREEARLAFSRSPTRGYLRASSGENLLDSDYPGHRGLPGAKVVALKEGRATLELKAPLGLRDGLLSLPRNAPGQAPLEAKAFSVGELRDAATGRFLVHARSGGLVEIGAPPGLAVGQELERVSAREFDRRTPSPEEYPPALLVLRGRLFFEAVDPEETGGHGVTAGSAAAASPDATPIATAARLSLDLELPRFDALPGKGSSLLLVDEEALPLEKGKNPGGFSKALALFAESGEAPFRLQLSFVEGAGARLGDAFVPLSDLFVPPSLLKKAKNRLYARAEEALALAEEAYAARAAAEAGSASGARGASDRAGLAAAEPQATAAPTRDMAHPAAHDRAWVSRAADAAVSAGRAAAAAFALDAIPPRSHLVFPHPELTSGLPFATPRILAEGQSLPEWGGARWLPLSPLVADLPAYEALVEERVGAELEAGGGSARLCVGIGGLHHAALARRLKERFHDAGGRLSFFGDIHLYVANRLALGAWSELVPGLAFAYHYLEAPAGSFEVLKESLAARAAEALGAPGEGAAPGEAAAAGGRLPPVASLGGGAAAGIQDPAFEPPLFLSRGCLLKHHAAGGACPEGCSRRWTARLADRDRRYLALVEDCVTMLFRLP